MIGRSWPPVGCIVVTDYGAKGDGTTDDAPAVQAAQNALEARTSRGCLIFPPGKYLFHSAPVSITKEGILWRGMAGPAYNSDFGSELITDVNAQDLVFVNPASLLQEGPAFEYLNFRATGAAVRTSKLLHATKTNTGSIIRCSFNDGGAGIYLEDGGADNSYWNIDNPTLRNCLVSIDMQGSSGGGQNTVHDGRFVMTTAGDIGIQLGANMATCRIHHNKMDGPGGGSATLVIGISSLSNGLLADFNDFEGVAPCLQIPSGATGNQGRGHKFVGNSCNTTFTGAGGSFTGNLHTNTTIDSISGSLTAANVTGGRGYVICETGGTRIPASYTYGSGAPSTGQSNMFTLDGGVFVDVVNSSSSLTLSAAATATASGVALTIAPTPYGWPRGFAWPVIAHSNSFISAPAVPNANQFNDGG